MENYQYMENFNPNTSNNEGVNPQRVGETSIQPQMPIEAQDTRHFRKEQVDELRKKTQEIYSQVIDSMIDSRDEKGQYFGILGKKEPETGIDHRVLILPNPVMIDGQPKGLLAITQDGALLLKNRTWDSISLPMQGMMQKQIEGFYQNELLPKAYDKTLQESGYNYRDTFPHIAFGEDIIYTQTGYEVEPLYDMEVIGEAIKNNQEKAESPFRGQYLAELIKLDEARSLFDVVNSLPPKE